MDERFLQAIPVATSTVTMIAMWFVATSDRVSYTGLLWLVGASVALGAALLFRRCWIWAVGAFVAAVLVYVGRGVGGLSGISLLVLGAGVASFVLAVMSQRAMSQRSGNDLTETRRRSRR